MAKNYNTILWSKQSENDLDDILEYYLETSPEKAYLHINNIINSVEQIVFSEQWQVDEYDTSFRRIIVNKKFKVYYTIDDSNILITRVYPTQKKPKKLNE